MRINDRIKTLLSRFWGAQADSAYRIFRNVHTPVGREYFPHDGYLDARYDAELLLKVSEIGIVDRLLWQVWMLIQSGRDIRVIPPEGTDPADQAGRVNAILRFLWRFDAMLDVPTVMAQLWRDMLTFGSGLAEIGWGRVDGWQAPEFVQYLDAISFAYEPYGLAGDDRYVTGRVLRGIVYDTVERRYHYYQSPGAGKQPVEIPPERVLHIRDKRARYPDGMSYLAGIVPTVRQLEFVRKAFMQRVNRLGAPTLGIRVQELKDPLGRPLPEPFGRGGRTRFQAAYEAAVDLAKNYGKDTCTIFWPEHEPIWPDQNLSSADIIQPDEYLKREILNHLIPRDWIEQNEQAVSKSSTPLLKLVMLVVNGWREIVSEPFQRLYTNILEANGFQGWAVEFEYSGPDIRDGYQEHMLALEAFKAGAITLDRFYEETGRRPLTDSEREQLEARQMAQCMTPFGSSSTDTLHHNASRDDWERVRTLLKEKNQIVLDTLKEFGYLHELEEDI